MKPFSPTDTTMTAILGISAFYHDSAAALVVDGQTIAAAQEERFTRKKHDHTFPQNAVDFCLARARLVPEDLDYVGFYDKPIRKFERLLETYLAYAPVGYRSFRRAIPLWLKEKLHLPRMIDHSLRSRFKGRYVFTDHHQSHAASAFFPSPFFDAAIITLDGVGEWSTCCHGSGTGNTIQLDQEIRFPHSLGLLYSAFTYYAGFRVNSGEYKLMGLAPYGEPRFVDLILEHLIDIKPDGSFRMDMSYFNYCQGLTMTSGKFHKLFGGPPRKAESEITQRDKDLAASIQVVTEEVVLRTARHVHQTTGMKNLVFAGGVALNCVANGRILREGPFENIWIQPAAGDAGGALGTALLIWYQLLDQPRRPAAIDSQSGSQLGPSFDDREITQFLDRQSANYQLYPNDQQLCDQIASLLAKQQIVGWFQGRMEFGPRALGSRSILGDPRSDTMQSVMNRKIKFRESFRPFAPAVLREHVDQWFQMRPHQESPYMSLVVPIADEIRTQDARRSTLPAITHVDHSARVQTVDTDRNPLFHQLLTCFHRQTGCPALINTSFNVRGEPIVCSPEDAYRCFLATDMDVLAMGHAVLLKSQQPASGPHNRSQHLSQFQLD